MLAEARNPNQDHTPMEMHDPLFESNPRQDYDEYPPPPAHPFNIHRGWNRAIWLAFFAVLIIDLIGTFVYAKYSSILSKDTWMLVLQILCFATLSSPGILSSITAYQDISSGWTASRIKKRAGYLFGKSVTKHVNVVYYRRENPDRFWWIVSIKIAGGVVMSALAVGVPIALHIGLREG